MKAVSWGEDMWPFGPGLWEFLTHFVCLPQLSLKPNKVNVLRSLPGSSAVAYAQAQEGDGGSHLEGNSGRPHAQGRRIDSLLRQPYWSKQGLVHRSYRHTPRTQQSLSSSQSYRNTWKAL